VKTLFILNDPPYGSERTYNGLRLAGALAKQAGHQVRVFLMGDAASAGKAGQKVPSGFYNIQLMLDRVAHASGEIGACGSCLDARAIKDEELAEGVHRSSLDQLGQWTAWADKVLVF
jgi:uncharacterized protein involved in oxidation of intracellular sulfur